MAGGQYQSGGLRGFGCRVTSVANVSRHVVHVCKSFFLFRKR